MPPIPPTERNELAYLASRGWSLKRSLDTRSEVSHAFVVPALLQVVGATLATRACAWTERVRAIEAELDRVQAEIDDRCFNLYDIAGDDRRVMTHGLGGVAEGSPEADEESEGDGAGEDEAENRGDAAMLVAELVSWAAGVAIGRFDLRLGTGERAVPGEPGPFDALPVCSPGMLTDEDGLPPDNAPSAYPIDFPADGVLVSDPGDPRDLTAAVRGVFEAVFGARADEIWQEAAALLDPKRHDLGAWLAWGSFNII